MGVDERRGQKEGEMGESPHLRAQLDRMSGMVGREGRALADSVARGKASRGADLVDKKDMI